MWSSLHKLIVRYDDGRHDEKIIYQSILNGVTLPELLHSQTDMGATPLHLACLTSHPKLVELLIDSSADVNARDNVGATPLHYACSAGTLEAVQILLNTPKMKYRAKDVDKKTSLHWACESLNPSPEIVELLITMHPKLMKMDDMDGNRPLHTASLEGFQEAIQIMVDLGFDSTKENHRGQTARDLAKTYEMEEVLQVLERSTSLPEIRLTGKKSIKSRIISSVKKRVDTPRPDMKEKRQSNSSEIPLPLPVKVRSLY